MPVFLRYKHDPGEVTRTRQDLVLTYEQPSADPMVGRMNSLVEIRVVEEHPDQTWTLQTSAAVENQEGYIPPSEDGPVNLRVSAMGELMSASGPFFWPITIFPSGPVVKKFGWKTEETCVGRAVPMEHTVKMLDPIDTDTHVHIVSEGKMDGDPSVHFLAVRVFSSKRGQFLEGQSAVTLTWSTGVKFSATMDERQP